MTMRQITVPGTTDYGLGKQFSGIYFPIAWDSLYFLGLLGYDYHVGAPSEGNPLIDLSGNGRTLTRTGANASAGFKTLHFIGNGNDYLTTPFTTDDIVADTTGGGVAGEFSAHFIGIAPVTESNKFASNQAVAASYSNRYVDMGANATFDSSLIFHDGVEADVTGGGNPVDADRSKYRSWGFGLRPRDAWTEYQQGLKEFGQAEYPNDNYVDGTSAIGGGPWKLVTSGLTSFNFKVSFAAFFNRILTPREHGLLDIEVRRVLTSYGLDFS